MKTNVITVKNDNTGIEEALNETERFAGYQRLGKKEALQLRLLSEEMMGMVKSIVGEFSARFWIEGSGKEAQLFLEAQAAVDLDKQNKLLSVSSSGKNYAHRTFMGKLAGLFESCMMSYDETAQYLTMSADLMYDPAPGFGFDRMWKLDAYRDKLQKHLNDAAEREQWDELEKSIVANLADEVIVGVKSRKVQMIIKKSFQTE